MAPTKTHRRTWMLFCLSIAALIASANPVHAKSKDTFAKLLEKPELTVLTDFTLFTDGRDAKTLVIVASSTFWGGKFAGLVNEQLAAKKYTVAKSVSLGGGFGVDPKKKAIVLQAMGEKYYDAKSAKDRRGEMKTTYTFDPEKIKTPPYYNTANLNTSDAVSKAQAIFASKKSVDTSALSDVMTMLGTTPAAHVLLVSAQVKFGSTAGDMTGRVLGGLIGMAISGAFKPGLDLNAQLIDSTSGAVVWTKTKHADQNPTESILYERLEDLLSALPVAGSAR